MVLISRDHYHMTQKTARAEIYTSLPYEQFKNKKSEEKVNLPGELHLPGILLVSTVPALADMFTCSWNMKFVTFCMLLLHNDGS